MTLDRIALREFLSQTQKMGFDVGAMPDKLGIYEIYKVQDGKRKSIGRIEDHAVVEGKKGLDIIQLPQYHLHFYLDGINETALAAKARNKGLSVEYETLDSDAS